MPNSNGRNMDSGCPGGGRDGRSVVTGDASGQSLRYEGRGTRDTYTGPRASAVGVSHGAQENARQYWLVPIDRDQPRLWSVERTEPSAP